MRNIVVKTIRLQLEPKTLEEMQQMHDAEQEAEMKQAYQEMIDSMKAIPDHEEWASDWWIKLQDGTSVGGIGFKGMPNEQGAVDVGYGIDEAYRRQGYATEALAGILDWAYMQDGVKVVTAETLPDNEISQKTLFSNGFVPTGRMGEEGPIFEKKRTV